MEYGTYEAPQLRWYVNKASAPVTDNVMDLSSEPGIFIKQLIVEATKEKDQMVYICRGQIEQISDDISTECQLILNVSCKYQLVNQSSTSLLLITSPPPVIKRTLKVNSEREQNWKYTRCHKQNKNEM